CYLVKHVTPELASGQPLRSPFNSGSFMVHGVAPVYQQIRSMNLLAAGRLLTEADFDAARTVCVVGDQVSRQLFAGRAALNARVFIGKVPFTVVGVLAKKEQHNNSYNGLDDEKVLVPYPTMARHFPDQSPFLGRQRLDDLIV